MGASNISFDKRCTLHYVHDEHESPRDKDSLWKQRSRFGRVQLLQSRQQSRHLENINKSSEDKGESELYC